MTAAQFRRAVDAEIAHLRSAHVVTIVGILTDVVVGVTMFIDDNLHEFSMRVSTMDDRERAFDTVLVDLRNLRIDLVPRRRPTPRMRIPVEGHVGEPRAIPMLVIGACLAILVGAMFGWGFM